MGNRILNLKMNNNKSTLSKQVTINNCFVLVIAGFLGTSMFSKGLSTGLAKQYAFLKSAKSPNPVL